jgi:hypothetical protein
MRGPALGTSALLVSLALGSAPGCADDAIVFPVSRAPASRHVALRDALAADARGFAFQGGAWLEDQRDAAGFGLATLARRAATGGLDAEERARLDAALARARALLAGPVDAAGVALEEQVLAAFGVLEHVAAGGAGKDARADADAVLGFLDRLDAVVRGAGDDLERLAATSPAVQAYGSTVATGIVALLHAQAAISLDASPSRADEHRARAVALEKGLYARAFGDLADPGSARSARGFASGPGRPGLTLLPNVVMMLVETRLFRLTQDETYRLGARALFAAIQPLSLGVGAGSGAGRWAEPERGAELGATTRDVTSLAGQSALALALLSVFEVTGDARYVDEADRVVDAIEAARGPWCTSQLGPSTCAPACGDGQACLSGACEADRCASGLLHHAVDGKTAAPGGQGRLFCSGCSFLAQWAVGARRELAGEGF